MNLLEALGVKPGELVVIKPDGAKPWIVRAIGEVRPAVASEIDRNHRLGHQNVRTDSEYLLMVQRVEDTVPSGIFIQYCHRMPSSLVLDMARKRQEVHGAAP